MIKYSLRCADGHDFESWFQSGEAYDALASKGLLSCAVCGGGGVSKALMAPKVGTKGNRKEAANLPAAPKLSEPASKLEKAISELRAKVEANSTWVGKGFAKEVRAQASGETPERPVWGEATPSEAKSMLEDGLPVAPLPFRPKAKSN
ncbi:DUF1178 family protein [Jannaschia sp. Os4]|uniref:DUF1178 family protein n=1 Tax=Jannaschia sp. Os4 TaxID=2807617 RepID=UPI00193A1308|nr:DUF1178 family protein [Jannaschia sp. Os4]MBM2577619.1 DUF1178 family protein [Jannaschia sp. Os4]